jgi:hypothetical protein
MKFISAHKNLLQKFNELSELFHALKRETVGRDNGISGIGQIVVSVVPILIAIAAVAVSIIHR